MTDLFFNEVFVGNVDNSQDFVNKLKQQRRKGKLSLGLNVSYDEKSNEIYIDTASGRVRRPLVVVEEGKSLLTKEHLKQIEKNELTWEDLINQGIVEYLDTAEEENALVAQNETELTLEHTHLEISSLLILGLTTALVPYAHCGQSSRLNRGSKAQKQALGLYANNYLVRLDTDANILHYPQTPIVRGFMHKVSEFDKHPSGQNITIALMSFKGYNMQDGIIINKGSIDRGLGRSTFFRPYSAEEQRYSGGLMDEVGIPDKEIKGYKSEEDYRFLEGDGIVFPGAKLNSDDVIVGKTSPPRFLDELEEFSIMANIRRESSVTVKHGEAGVVDAVFITENEEGNKLVQIRLRNERIPEVGDKFTSRYGQKGVIGSIVPAEDMPFSASGVIPDLIFSPHGIPSRMTVSHLIEILAGKVGSLAGRQIDGTIFDAEPVDELKDQLLQLGFRKNGTEKFYNGITGVEYDADIYVGVMYYQKLKHMATGKLHARASGRIELLTRQPVEGRSQGGGLRLGEMEKDCLVGHGASLLLKERFDSDKTALDICENCGEIAIASSYQGKKICKVCGAGSKISSIETSYAFKLLLDELRAMGLNTMIQLKSKF